LVNSRHGKAIRISISKANNANKVNFNIMPTEKEIKEEDKKVRHLRRMVDLIISLIAQTDMPLEEASRIAASAKGFAERLFPGKGNVFDLIYAPRLKRLINEKYGLH
jgi:hypothetical protein